MAALQSSGGEVPPPQDVVGESEQGMSPLGIAPEAAKYLQNLNIGLANTLGAPVDMMSNLSKAIGIISPETKPVLGSEQIREFFTNIGAAPEKGQEQKGYAARALRLAGETAVPFLGATSYGAKLAASAPTAMTGVQKAMLAAYQAPWKAIGAETTAVLAGAAGGEAAVAAYPDSYVAEVFGELLGGITPAALTSVTKVLPAAKLVKSVVSGEGAAQRAADRIAQTAGDVDRARLRVLDATELNLDPFTATGDAGLLALEKAAIEQDPKLADRIAKLTSESMRMARNKVLSGGSPEDTINFLETIRRNAAANAQSEIIKLGGKLDPVTAARAVRKSVETSLKTARDAEKVVWSKLPTEGLVDPTPIRNTLEGIIADRSIAADPEDIPAFVYQLLGKPKTGGGLTEGLAVKNPQLKVMKDLRSRLQAEMVAERAKDAPNRNKIRILGQIEDSVYDSLTKVSPEYEEAVTFSRQLNEKFTRGKIGDLLGYERTGELSTSTEGTLDFLMSGNKDDVRMGLRQLAQASPEAIPLVKESVKGTFAAQALDVDSGALNVRNARRFLKNNEHVLNEFPEIKEQIERSIQSQRVVDELAGAPIGDKLSTYMKEKSVAALYLDGTPDKAMHRLVTAKNSDGAGTLMKRMVEMTNQDPTGAATKGLKSAFGSYLLRHSETGDVGTLSGKKFLTMLEHLGPAANQLYTKDEVARLYRIGSELRKIEAREATRATKGGVISDVPNKIISLIGGTFAARAGAKLGAGTSGASLRTASLGTRYYNELLGRLTNDGAEQILMKAVEDKTVLNALLKEASPENIREANKVFKSFLTGQVLVDAQGKEEGVSLEERMEKLRKAREMGLLQ